MKEHQEKEKEEEKPAAAVATKSAKHNGGRKLSSEQSAAIKADKGTTAKGLATKYGVSVGRIYELKRAAK